ncbi:MAG: ATP-binding cassette domain-containing protein [Dermatophilaceae bacterium]
MIEITKLTKQYGAHTAVTDVTCTVRPGVVTGLLGPNGAGKSTTLRMLVGLTRPTAGVATILGRRYVDLPAPAATVGVLLDSGGVHPGRTGLETVTLAAMALGVDRRRTDGVLRLVGLTPAETKRPLRAYSLGMRQRLGVAAALLADPQVLILDEPANGLDPQGIAWMRELLCSLAAQGRTILLSSHLLHEVDLIADDVLIMGAGRVLAAGPKADIVGSSTLEERFFTLTASTSRTETAA